MTRDRVLHTALTMAVVVGLAGCSPTPKYVINKPANSGSIVCSDPAGVSCKVDVDVQWDGVSVRPQPETELDGTLLTVTYGTSGKSSVTILTMPTGSHTLKVSGDLMAKQTISNYSATSAFTVTAAPPPTGGFGLSANPSTLIVERGKSATTTVTVNRMAPFAAAVVLALTAPPTGVSMAPATIVAGASTATVTISASAAAVNATTTVALSGTSAGVPTAGLPLKITVGRVSGAFAVASPTPYQSTPATKNAAVGGFRVDISTGPPSVPQPLKASFFRGTTAVGGDIGFTLGTVSSLGGAGFCANSPATALTRGVVLSGVLPGHSSQNTITFLDVTATSPRLIEVPADSRVQHNATGPFIQFLPQVFFSPDCTFALVAGANALGPSNHILRVYDLISGLPIGAEVSFNTNIFSALVRTTSTRQEIEIKVDAGTTSVHPVP